MTLQAQAGPSQLEAFGAAVLGCLAGCALGWALATALSWRNLRGSFALPLTLAGYVAVVQLGQAFYGWALLIAGLVGARLRSSWLREDERAGGELARRAREALTVRAFLANWWERLNVTRSGRLLSGGRYPLGIDSRGQVVWQPLGLQGGRHTLIIGATGTGKTTTMLWALLRHLDADFGAVVIDAKGDPELVERCRAAARSLGRAFYSFSLDLPCQPWNPLFYGSASERADKLIAAEEWTEPHYKRLYQRYLLAVFTALDARDEEADLATVVDLLNPDRLALLCRDIENEQTAHRLSDYLEELTADERRDLAGLRNRLAILTEGERGDLLSPNGDPAEEIDLLLAVNQRAVVVFSLNSSLYPETAKLLGAAVFQDLKRVAGQLEAQPYLRSPSLVAVDEFGAFGADHVLGLFQRARSPGLSLLLATQELADLRRVDPGFQDQLLGNVETIIAHRQNLPDSAELVAGIAGTREVWEHTFQTDNRRSAAEGHSGLGTRRRGHQFNVPPDTIKQLGTGEAVVIQKSPHATRRVVLFKPGSPKPPGEGKGPELEAALRRAAFESMYPPDVSAAAVERTQEQAAA
jgi:conjugal transfer pilus assembly protein TraD